MAEGGGLEPLAVTPPWFSGPVAGPPGGTLRIVGPRNTKAPAAISPGGLVRARCSSSGYTGISPAVAGERELSELLKNGAVCIAGRSYAVGAVRSSTRQDGSAAVALTPMVKGSTLYDMKSTISSKGQITVPVELREQLGLTPGTAVAFELREDGILLRKGVRGEHPVDRVYGSLRLGRPVDELIDEMRGPRPATGSARRR